MQAYHACVSFIDAQFQLILDSLEKSGQEDNTIVLFTSDIARLYHLGDHFLWGKVTLFDIGAKVPFLLRDPGVTKPGTTSQAMVELVDIYPTLAHLTGLTPQTISRVNPSAPYSATPNDLAKEVRLLRRIPRRCNSAMPSRANAGVTASGRTAKNSTTSPMTPKKKGTWPINRMWPIGWKS